jgi:pilus assembly protein CpaD
MLKTKSPVDRSRSVRLAFTLAVLSLSLGACVHTGDDTTASIAAPNDYRLRHPIVIQEATRTIDVFVGNTRGGLSAPQRADVIALAETWLREGTGVIIVDVPVGTPNARPAADSSREILGLLAAGGVPPRAVKERHYHPDDPRQFATIRLTYPKITANAGPCGLWPQDLGLSIKDKDYYDNKPYYNLGCASQHNLAAMLDNPTDIVQPRPETPAYTARRTVAFAHYRKGETTTTTYPEADKAKLSDVGK